jgi:hypothetical protein
VRALLFVVGLAGCGSETTTIDLLAPGQQRYFEGQIDGRPWQKLTGTFDGAATSYELSIDGDFELVMASTALEPSSAVSCSARSTTRS